MTKSKVAPYFFLLPVILLLAVFKLYPIMLGMKNSMYAPSFLAGEELFVGWDHYVSLFADKVFWNSVYVTLFFNVFINPIQIALAFLLALMLNMKLRGIAWFRSIHIVPIAVSIPIACVLWNIMLNPEQGVINSLLVTFGLPQQPFLTSKGQAIWVIMAIATWKGVGYWAVFLLAGLQEIPKSLYEASSIDGAGKIAQLKNVTFPMMKRSLTFVAVADTIANFLLFAPMYILTGGGPENSTNVLMQESYNSAFVYSDPGRASAIVILLLLMILAIIGVQFRLLRTKV